MSNVFFETLACHMRARMIITKQKVAAAAEEEKEEKEDGHFHFVHFETLVKEKSILGWEQSTPFPELETSSSTLAAAVTAADAAVPPKRGRSG